jgi:hypothetical protein
MKCTVAILGVKTRNISSFGKQKWICGAPGGDYEEYNLLRYNAV